MRSPRLVLSPLVFALACLLPTRAHAGGAIVAPSEGHSPVYVHVRMAIAAGPAGSTRWTQVTVPPQKTRALWLVPVRPGAAIDWASDRWLDALDLASAPQVLPPTEKISCDMPTGIDRVPPWTSTTTTKSQATALSVQTTTADVGAYATEHGYSLSHELTARVDALYQSGWRTVALELGSSTTASTSATLRVSDDGGAVLPLALSGGTSTRLTVFAIGSGVASLPNNVDVDQGSLRWGYLKSNYADWRSDVIEKSGDVWLRESASHDAIFTGTPSGGVWGIPSVVDSYFADPSCADAAWRLRSSTGTVGTTCPPGAAARVPGGMGCVPSTGSVDPAVLSCATKLDLALALSGLTPQSAVVTRWVAATSSFQTNLAIELDATTAARSPLLQAASYDLCSTPPEGGSSGTTAPPLRSPGVTSAPPTDEAGPILVSDGCGGPIVASGGSDSEEEPATDSSSSSDGCSGDSSGWDSGDDSTGWDDDEGCSTDSDSSSSSDSCSGDSTGSEDSGDGWDTEDEMNPKSKVKTARKPHAAMNHKKKARSHVSRFALLGVAILLPLRRRRRPEWE